MLKKLSRIGLCLSLLAMATIPLAPTAHAQDLDRGIEAYEQGDFATALKEWRPLAESGNAKAQYWLGRMYEYGEGVSRNYAIADEWFRRAAEEFPKLAEQGDAKASLYLGIMYDSGWGVAENEATAIRWYRKAAEQENAVAQYFMGNSYEYGWGVAKNHTKAIEWYRKAANQGHELAQRQLEGLQ